MRAHVEHPLVIGELGQQLLGDGSAGAQPVLALLGGFVEAGVLDRGSGAVVDELNISNDAPFGDLDADPFEQNGHVVIASNTRGVISVDNQIRVESAKPGAAREGGTDMADAWITMKV